MSLNEKVQFRNDKTQKSRQYFVAEESRERLKPRQGARTESCEARTQASSSRSSSAQGREPDRDIPNLIAKDAARDRSQLSKRLRLLDDVSKDTDLCHRVLEHSEVQPFEAARILFNDEIVKVEYAQTVARVPEKVRAFEENLRPNSKDDQSKPDYADVQRSNQAEVTGTEARKAPAGQKEPEVSHLSIDLSLQSILGLAVENSNVSQRDQSVDQKSDRDVRSVGSELELKVRESEPWRVIAEIDTRLWEEPLQERSSNQSTELTKLDSEIQTVSSNYKESRSSKSDKELEDEPINHDAERLHAASLASENRSHERDEFLSQHTDFRPECALERQEGLNAGYSNLVKNEMELPGQSGELLGLSTEITTVITSDGLRSFGEKCSDEILANQRETTSDVRERESTLVHDEASQGRSKDLPFCQGRSDTTPVSDGTILPVSARKDEHLLKGPNGSASERRQEIGAEILDSKTRSAPDLEDQKRVKHLNSAHIELTDRSRSEEKQHAAKNFFASELNIQKRLLERDLHDKYEAELDRQVADEPKPGRFCTVCHWSDGKVEVLGHWTARTVEEFDRHDPDAAPTSGAVAAIIRIDRAWRAWQSRVGIARELLDNSRYRQSRASFDRDDNDR